MAQTSLPQAGSSVGDSGPYTADDWAKFYEVMFTGDQAATQGVLRNYLNELEVTGAGNTISINTGAGLCYGHWLLNDASVDITALACAGVETGWNRVVLVQNETAAAYNTNLMLPAAYAAGVPRNSCRIAILRGTCGSPGVLPALLTGPNYYMVELARYQVTGGAVGTITDYRDFCEFSTLLNADSIENRTRTIWVPALTGYNDSASTNILCEFVTYNNGPYLELPNAVQSQGWGRTIIPSDFLSDLSVQPVMLTGPASGNVYGWSYASWGGCGESSVSGITSSLAADSLSAINYNCLSALSCSGIATDDFLSLTYIRSGADALDTVNAGVMLLGWVVTYTADS